jgi:hypothetical protein
MHITDMMICLDSPGENVGDPLVGSRSHFAPGVYSQVGKEINVKNYEDLSRDGKTYERTSIDRTYSR